jgi:hypothetical protein
MWGHVIVLPRGDVPCWRIDTYYNQKWQIAKRTRRGARGKKDTVQKVCGCGAPHTCTFDPPHPLSRVLFLSLRRRRALCEVLVCVCCEFYTRGPDRDHTAPSRSVSKSTYDLVLTYLLAPSRDTECVHRDSTVRPYGLSKGVACLQTRPQQGYHRQTIRRLATVRRGTRRPAGAGADGVDLYRCLGVCVGVGVVPCVRVLVHPGRA